MAEWAAREWAEGPARWVTVQGGAENVTTPTLDENQKEWGSWRDWSYTPPLQTPEPDSVQGGGKKSPTLDDNEKSWWGSWPKWWQWQPPWQQPSASSTKDDEDWHQLSLLLPAR